MKPTERTIDAPAVSEDVVDERLPDDLRQELVHDDPLVVPAHQALRFAEDLVRAPATIARSDVVDCFVVEHQERRVQTGKDDVLVVARIAEDRRAVRRARQIFEQSAVLDAQLDAAERLARVRRPYSCGLRTGPPPYTESRSIAGERVFVESSGRVGSPSVEPRSNVTS